MPQESATVTEARTVETEQPKPGRSKTKIVIGVVVFAVILIIAICSRRKSAAQTAAAGKNQQRPVPVAVTTVQSRDVPVYLEGLGNVQAYLTVTVKTRVDGQLLRFNFQEGQKVRKGDELALLDPRPFEAALSQAEAAKARDAAQLENARKDVERYAAMYKAGVIPQQQYDTQVALVGSDVGTIKVDDAAIENAKLNLSYCHIQSPLDGTVGLRLVDAGNMVHASDANGLMVITQLQPIAVLFTLPEDEIPEVAQRMNTGKLSVEAWSQDGTKKVATGSLLTLDNQIDTNTGTVRLKSVFDNKDGALFPNQFVNARLQVEVRKNAITIPAAALQRGAQGTYVYVVGRDQKVTMRPVAVALTEGTLVVIDHGVNPGEQVVTDGQDKIQPGSTVEPHDPSKPDTTKPHKSRQAG